jgi:hypothetical protein
MTRISKYTFSILLVFIAMNSFAQNEERKGISIGIDLSRFFLPIVDSTRTGWEISGNYEITKDLFGYVELGTQSTEFNDPEYHYSSKGGYTRIGIDYNYMKHVAPESADKMLIGIRYGFTSFYHEADNISISDDIWGTSEGSYIERTWMSASWMEITMGMKAHLFNNFYMGWTTRFKVKLWEQNDDQMEAYYIPGFGRAWSNTRIGLNYSLFYKIPLSKKDKKN